MPWLNGLQKPFLKAFLVNHAEFEAIVSLLEKIIFTKYEEGAIWVTLSSLIFFLSHLFCQSYKEWASCIKCHVWSLI